MNFLKKRAQEATSENTNTAVKKKALSKKKIILIVLAVVAIFAVVRVFSPKQKTPSTASIYTTADVAQRSITSALTGSGALEAADSYTVTSLVEGEILSADFEEGDVMEKDSTLFEIDSSDLASSIETSQMSLQSSQRGYSNAVKDVSNLTVTAPVSGTIVTLNVDVGDKVSAGQTVAVLRNSSVMELKVDFPADDAVGFYIGQSATVTLDSSFETLPATVSNVSGTDKVSLGNSIVRTVTFEVSNPGGISTTQLATAEISGVGSSGNGNFEYIEERNITADVSGDVSSIPVSEGDWLSSGQTIIRLSSDNLSDSIQSQSEAVRRSEIALENAQKTLENFTITSPISGTIVDKNYKSGETAEQGKVLCTIYDLSYLALTLNVDELDISSIAVGQDVSITADAVPDKEFKGEVTKVSVVGTTSGGVTTYPVTIRIDEYEGLRPGMNVDATIIMSEVDEAIAIPISALERGDRVLITTTSPSAANAIDAQAPEGYVYVSVKTGISDDDFIEIIEGLTEGDTVAYIPQDASSNPFMFMQGGGGGAVMVTESGPGGGPGGY